MAEGLREGPAPAEVLAEAPAGREVDVAAVVVSGQGRSREEDGSVFHRQGLVLVDGPRLDQPLTALLQQALLGVRVQIIHLNRQLPPEVVEQYPRDALSGRRAG